MELGKKSLKTVFTRGVKNLKRGTNLKKVRLASLDKNSEMGMKDKDESLKGTSQSTSTENPKIFQRIKGDSGSYNSSRFEVPFKTSKSNEP